MKWSDVLPVAVSMLVILLVAIVEKHSRLVAALTATMPLTAPLALWVVFNSARGDQAAVTQIAPGYPPHRRFLGCGLVGGAPGSAAGAAVAVGLRRLGGLRFVVVRDSQGSGAVARA